jgi:hypothetical protein
MVTYGESLLLLVFQTGNPVEANIYEESRKDHQMTCYQDAMKMVFTNRCKGLIQISSATSQMANLIASTITLVCYRFLGD